MFKMTQWIIGAGNTNWDNIQMIIRSTLPKLYHVLFGGKKSKVDKARDFLIGVIKHQMEVRKNQTKKRNDMIDLLTEAFMGQFSEDEEVKQQIEEELAVARPTRATAIKEDMLETVVIANLFLLFFAGYSTSSTMISVCIYFLAKNPDIQEKLFQEINDAEYNENMKDYSSFMC